jgi:hypothetical protein
MSSSFLKNLPSKGLLTATTVTTTKHSAVQQEIPRYVCDHDTATPEGCVIQSDQTSLLLRSLCAAGSSTPAA